jgi:hypothetical protein
MRIAGHTRGKHLKGGLSGSIELAAEAIRCCGGSTGMRQLNLWLDGPWVRPPRAATDRRRRIEPRRDRHQRLRQQTRLRASRSTRLGLRARRFVRLGLAVLGLDHGRDAGTVSPSSRSRMTMTPSVATAPDPVGRHADDPPLVEISIT